MRAKAGILIVLGLFLIMGTVSAIMADTASTITTNKEWPVASYQSTTITVVARNTSSGNYVSPATVVFTVDDAVYGTINPSTVPVDAFGVATSTFLTKTKSGTAVINATIQSDDGGIPYSIPIYLNQKIDHNLIQFADFDNPAKLPVATAGSFNITLTDVNRNPIDNKNPAEIHSFFVYMPMGGNYGAGVWDGTGYKFMTTVQTDTFGKAPVQFRLLPVATTNEFWMDTIGDMVTPPHTYIQGLSLDVPCYISQTFPSPDWAFADGIQNFGIYFTIRDQYRNPVNNTPVLITASDGVSYTNYTNSLGTVFITYGPKDLIGHYTINATPLMNTSAVCESPAETGYCSQVVEFVYTDPVDLIATANPQGMTSYDVNSAVRGTILARVVDIKGNPVAGENVRFAIGTPTYPGGPYNVTSPPSISATSAPVAAGGYATVLFTPGGFASFGMLNYNATATGMVPVTVTWTNRSGVDINRVVNFMWKNYPYLGITVPPDVCKNAKVGDKINFSVIVSGDGAALQPKPIDVILVTDMSGSMGGQKIIDARDAGKIFGASMSAQDRVGLESFGWSDPGIWTTKAKDDLILTFATPAGKNLVNTTIGTYVATGNTPMRPAIYNATLLIKNDPRPGAVKAIVLLTDGQWNYCGDPRGISTSYTRMAWAGTDPVLKSESVVTFAKNNGIRIYTVGLGAGANAAELQAYATETNGKYYFAPTSSQLATIYQQIAGDLRETAGGNTVVSLNFGTITLNDVVNGGSITDYMEYMPDVHSPALITDSTYINKTNLTPTGTMHSLLRTSQDDSIPWAAKAMTFAVGDINLNETWSATFRLNLTHAGKIDMFGLDNPTEVDFTDASTNTTTHQKINNFTCTIQQSIVDIPFGNKVLFVDNLSVSSAGPDPNILTIKWNTTYNGNLSAQETVGYRKTDVANSHYTPVPGGILFIPKCFEQTNILTIDTSLWPPGPYSIQVAAVALDAGNPGAIDAPWTKPELSAPKYIKLE